MPPPVVPEPVVPLPEVPVPLVVPVVPPVPVVPFDRFPVVPVPDVPVAPFVPFADDPYWVMPLLPVEPVAPPSLLFPLVVPLVESHANTKHANKDKAASLQIAKFFIVIRFKSNTSKCIAGSARTFTASPLIYA